MNVLRLGSAGFAYTTVLILKGCFSPGYFFGVTTASVYSSTTLTKPFSSIFLKPSSSRLVLRPNRSSRPVASPWLQDLQHLFIGFTACEEARHVGDYDRIDRLCIIRQVVRVSLDEVLGPVSHGFFRDAFCPQQDGLFDVKVFDPPSGFRDDPFQVPGTASDPQNRFFSEILFDLFKEYLPEWHSVDIHDSKHHRVHCQVFGPA